MRPVRLEELARVRLEQDDAGGPARLGRLLARDVEQRLVAAMHAVEVADGERGAARGGGNVVDAVEDLHGRGIADCGR